MIITDFNEMSIEELKAINKVLCMEYVKKKKKIIKAINGGNKNEQN